MLFLPPAQRAIVQGLRAICRQHDDESIERLVYLRDHSDNEWVVMAPIQFLFERGHGRPKFRSC